jgi:sulfite exporter TauE/SafE/copper chaperone CopZ
MHKTVVPIKGMHCKSCEVLVSEKLTEIPGVKSVKVSLKNQQAEVFSKQLIDEAAIRKAIEEAGYKVGLGENSGWVNRDFNAYKELGISAVILIVLYFLLSGLGVFSLSIGTQKESTNLFVVLLVGLIAGVSTCMALVGGLVLGIAARHAEKHPEEKALQKFRPHLFFNLGRIISYFILGGLIGFAGKVFQLSGFTLGIITILVALVMLFLGLKLTEISPRFSGGGFSLPGKISHLLGIKKRREKEYSHGNAMLLGAMTFFLPCGFTQAMQVYAMSTGNFISGALIMAIFAIGTAPGLLGVGGLTAIFKAGSAKIFYKFTGLLVIGLSVLNFSNGINLTGFTGFSLPGTGTVSTQAGDGNAAPVENGVQIVRMAQNAYGYAPNRFIIKKDLPVKWIIDSQDSNTCASSIYSSKLNINKFLEPGENVIEFTPKETGEIRFTCSMGMYSGKFTVIDNS